MPRRKQPNPWLNRMRWIFLFLIITVVALLIGLISMEQSFNSPAATQASPAPGLQWKSPPAMSIDPSKTYYATLQTSQGNIRIQLLADKAPVTVNNFIFLARAGFYDGTTFHRVLQGFMAQGGDPTGTGAGGPGYSFADEIVPGLDFSQPGMMAMANAGPNTNGSQFFITVSPQPSLNGHYSIFGKVADGMSVVQSLKLRDPNQNPDFLGDTLQKVTIEEGAVTTDATSTAAAMDVSSDRQPGLPPAGPDTAVQEKNAAI